MGNRLENKVALITGSTSGIGRATSKLFAAEGCKVVITGRRKNLGESAVEEIRAEKGEAVYHEADLSYSQAVRDLVRFTVDTYGSIDVLMNNAMFTKEGNALELTEEEWDGVVSAGLKAVFIACQEAIPHMIRKGGGSIINTSSVRGYVAAERDLAYSTLKAGLIHFTRSMAVDFGSHNIRANSVCPGAIMTERREVHIKHDPEHESRESLYYPLKRIGRCDEVAYAALFLASDESSFVTGTSIVVDGGLTCQNPDRLYPLFESYFRERSTTA